MPLLVKRYDLEGVPEEDFEYLFKELTADKLGYLPGETMKVGERSYTLIEVQRDVEDDLFSEPIDVILVQKKADQ